MKNNLSKHRILELSSDILKHTYIGFTTQNKNIHHLSLLTSRDLSRSRKKKITLKKGVVCQVLKDPAVFKDEIVANYQENRKPLKTK